MSYNPKLGDVVRHRSAKIAMVVVAFDGFSSVVDQRWRCSWIAENRQHEGRFRAIELELLPEPLVVSESDGVLLEPLMIAADAKQEKKGRK